MKSAKSRDWSVTSLDAGGAFAPRQLFNYTEFISTSGKDDLRSRSRTSG